MESAKSLKFVKLDGVKTPDEGSDDFSDGWGKLSVNVGKPFQYESPGPQLIVSADPVKISETMYTFLRIIYKRL